MSTSAAVAEEPQSEEERNLAAVPDEDSVELVIEGDGQISLLAGGRAADESSIVFRGGEVAVNGEFEKGTRLRFEIEGVCSEITFTDLMDRKTGDVKGTKRKHVLKLDGIKKLD